MVLELVRETLDVLARGAVVACAGQRLDFGIDGLVQAAELQLLLLGRVEQLLGAAGRWVEGVAVVLVLLLLLLLLRRRGRRRVAIGGGVAVVHLRQHPVVHLELR